MRPLVVVPQHFGSLIFDRGSSRYYPFDVEATAFLTSLIETPLSEAVELQTDPDAALDLIRRLDHLSFLRPDGRLAGELLDAVPPADHLLGPLAVHVEVIAQCNLRCSHCFADPLPRGSRDPLTLSELDRLFGELAALGSFRLGLTGGEPLLRKDLLDILDAATDAGLHPCLTTNGFFLSDEIARELRRRELVWLNVSLDGASPETNDAVRGAGSFETVMNRLRHLRDLARFTLAFTITSDNAHEVDECVRLAGEVGAHTAVCRPVYPTGAALKHPKLMPRFEMYQAALQRLSELSARGADSGCAHGAVPSRALEPFSPQARARSSGKVIPGHGCGAANTVCSVSVDGKVNPCSFLGSRFDSASIRERPFKDIWDEGWSFTKLRAEEGERFRGGCRARSLALKGSVHARDPWEAEWRHGVAEHPSRTLEVVLDH